MFLHYCLLAWIGFAFEFPAIDLKPNEILTGAAWPVFSGTQYRWS